MAKKNKVSIKKSHLIAALAAVILLIVASTAFTQISGLFLNNNINKTHDLSEVFPKEGFKTKIILGDVIPRLVASGAIDLEKFKEVYSGRLTEEQLRLLTEPYNEPLVITPQNANFLLTIFWPLGIANKNPVLNEAAAYPGVANLASTGGWSLGKEDAMVYFNKLELIRITPEQQAILEEVASNTYRPCCGNPTAFPDCNHGAALLALLEIGASQGLSKEELYTLALQANTLWFPQQYSATATYLNIKGIDYWSSAKEIMGFELSSGPGWANNVYKPLQELEALPQTQGGGSCGI